MKYLVCDFLDLCMMYIRDASSIEPDIFGLRNYRETELLRCGFERVGDADDFCLYEKDFLAAHSRHSVCFSIKRYFLKSDERGVGMSVAPGVRLITLLKRVLSNKSAQCNLSLDFYFYDGMKEGALVINDESVVRFSVEGARSGYHVREFESDQGEDGRGISVNTVKKLLNLYDFSEGGNKERPAALARLSEFLNRSVDFRR